MNLLNSSVLPALNSRKAIPQNDYPLDALDMLIGVLLASYIFLIIISMFS
jgi:hypothetical protein